MNTFLYLDIFQQAAGQLDKKMIVQKQIEVSTGIYLDSVVLKLYKVSWANQTPDPLTSASRIFFSVWANDQSIKENKILYNIHALKLRQLNGYTITSRAFAADFRKEFKTYAKHWPNIGVDYGPLTLMEGWVKSAAATMQDDIVRLAKQFLEIDFLIDDLLAKYKK